MSAESIPSPAPVRVRKLWKTALFLTGSALLGGVTLVLWNRRELTEIQDRLNQPETSEPPAPSEEDIY